MGDAKPKYLKFTGNAGIRQKQKPVWTEFCRGQPGSGHVIICEGYMDVIALCIRRALLSAVASLGTAFTGQHRRACSGGIPIMCCLRYDSDGAGVKAALRAIRYPAGGRADPGKGHRHAALQGPG